MESRCVLPEEPDLILAAEELRICSGKVNTTTPPQRRMPLHPSHAALSSHSLVARQYLKGSSPHVGRHGVHL